VTKPDTWPYIKRRTLQGTIYCLNKLIDNHLNPESMKRSDLVKFLMKELELSERSCYDYAKTIIAIWDYII